MSAIVVALGAAATYGATLEAYPIHVEMLLVPALIGLGLAIGTGTLFARELGVGTAALLIASWVAVLGSVAWVPASWLGPAPVISVAIVDWLLVHQSWPSVAVAGLALAGLVAAARVDRAGRASLNLIAVWYAAHVVAGAIEHAGARWEWVPWLGAATSLAVYSSAAVALIALARRARAPAPAAWIPCVVVLVLGPPAMIRASFEADVQTANAIQARIQAGQLEPWRIEAPAGMLPPDDVLLVDASGGRFAVHRGQSRRLGPSEIWAPAASNVPARIALDRDVTAAQLEQVLRLVGTHRVGLAALDHTPTVPPLGEVSIRAGVRQLAFVGIGLWPYPPPAAPRALRCVDLQAVPADDPLEPHLRGVGCIANAQFGEYSAAPPGPPPRPWLPARPPWPPLLILIVAVAVAWRGWRPNARSTGLVALTVIAAMMGAVAFRIATDA